MSLEHENDTVGIAKLNAEITDAKKHAESEASKDYEAKIAALAAEN